MNVLFKGITDESVSVVLKQWTTSYNKLSVEDDRRVREALNQTFITLIRSVNKKSLAPILKTIFPYWLLNLFDPNKEVQVAARNALNAALPLNKQSEAVSFCKSNIIDLIQENMELQPPQKSLEKDLLIIAQERYERLISSSIYSLSYLLDNLVNDSSLIELVSPILVENQKFWNLLSDKSILIRKSVYHLITILNLKLPNILESNLSKLSNSILSILNEKESLLQQEMWEALLSFIKVFPDSFKYVKVSSVLQRLYNYIRNCGYNGSIHTYQSLLPLVSLIPIQYIENPVLFYTHFLHSLLQGISSEFINRSEKLLFQSYLECLKYFIKVTSDSSSSQLELFSVCFLDLIKSYLSTQNLSCNFEELSTLMSDAYLKCIPLFTSDDVNLSLLNALRDYTINIISSDNNTTTIFYSRLSSLLVTLYSKLHTSSNSIPTIVLDNFDTSLQKIFIAAINRTNNNTEDSVFALQFVCSLTQSLPFSILLANSNWSEDAFFNEFLISNILKSLSIIDTDNTTKLHDNIQYLLTLLLNYLGQYNNYISSEQYQNVLSKLLSSNQYSLILKYIEKLSTVSLQHPLSKWSHILLDDYVKNNLTNQILQTTLLNDLICIRDILLVFVNNANILFTDLNTLEEIVSTKLSNNLLSIIQESTTSKVLDILVQRSIAILSVLNAFVSNNNLSSSYSTTRIKIFALIWDLQLETQYYFIHNLIHLVDSNTLQLSINEDTADDLEDKSDIYNINIDTIIHNSPISNYSRSLCDNPPLALLKDHSIEFLKQAITLLNSRLFSTKESSVNSIYVLHSFLLLEDYFNRLHNLYVNKLNGQDNILLQELLLSNQNIYNSICNDFSDSTLTIVSNLAPLQIYIQLEDNSKNRSDTSNNLLLLTKYSIFNCTVLKCIGLDNLLSTNLNLFSSILMQLSYVLYLDCYQDIPLINNLLYEYLSNILLQYFKNNEYWSFLLDKLQPILPQFLDSLHKLFVSSSNVNLIPSLYILLKYLYSSSIDDLLLAKFILPVKDNFNNVNTIDKMLCLYSVLAIKLKSNSSIINDTMLSWLSSTTPLDLNNSEHLFLLNLLVIYSNESSTSSSLSKNLLEKTLNQLNSNTLVPLSELVQHLLPETLEIRTHILKNIISCLETISLSSSTTYEDKIKEYHCAKILSKLYSNNNFIVTDEYSSKLSQIIINLLIKQHDIKDKISLKYEEDIGNIYNKFISFIEVKSIENKIEAVYSLLFSTVQSIQLCAYRIMCIYIQKGILVISAVEEETPTCPIPYPLNSLQNINSSSNTLALLLCWSLLLDQFTTIDNKVKNYLSIYFRNSRDIYNFLTILINLIDISNPPPYNQSIQDLLLNSPIDIQSLSSYLYLTSVKTFPQLVRSWYTDVERKYSTTIEKYTIKYISPIIIEFELSLLQSSNLDLENFRVKVNKSNKEIIVSYEKEELSISLLLRLPESYPLKTIEVESPYRTGVSEPLWRKWLLGMNTMLLTQDASIKEAVLLWKSNLDRHFEGLDVCAICYSIIHATSKSIPNLPCKTCKNKFHKECVVCVFLNVKTNYYLSINGFLFRIKTIALYANNRYGTNTVNKSQFSKIASSPSLSIIMNK